MAGSDVLKLRIAKKSYVFDTKRRFVNSMAFEQKKEKVGFEKLKDIGSALRGPKGNMGTGAQTGRAAEAIAAAGGAKPAGGGSLLSNPIVKIVGGVTIACVILIALFILVILPGMLRPTLGQEAQQVFGLAHFNVLDAGVLTVGTEEDKKHAVYSVITYTTKNLNNATFTARAYAPKMPTQVFVLDYPRDEAERYGEFRKTLTEEFSSRGISVTDISIERMETIPDTAVVIVPTGQVPYRFFEDDFDFKGLMARGVVIVYMGKNFDNSLRPDGTTMNEITPDQIARAGLPEIVFNNEKLQSADPFRMGDPLYGIGGSDTRRIYGSVSLIQADKGAFIFVPQTIDHGWDNGTEAGEDIAMLVSDYAWEKPLGGSASEIDIKVADGGENGTLTVFTPEYTGTDAYTTLSLIGYDSDGRRVGMTEELETKKDALGELFSNDGREIVSTILTGKTIRLRADLREPASGKVSTQLETYQNNEVLKMDYPPGQFNLQGQSSMDYDAGVAPGNYVLKLKDEAGRVYAQAGITVQDFEVIGKHTLREMRDGLFKYDFASANGVAFYPKQVTITLDGKSPMTFTGVTKTVEYQPGVQIQPNRDYNVSFDFGGITKEKVERLYQAQQFWERPEIIVMAVLSLAVFGIGVYMRRPDKEMYGLDIPDFPPLSMIKVPVGKSTVLGLFEQVNKDYSWEHMPLRLEEIKNGFRKISFKGKQVLISDYNLERILETLIAKGLVKQELGYYGLTAWEAETKATMAHLAMIRLLRDVFVANVIRFSKFGESDSCDTVILIGQEIYVHIFEGDETATKALSTCGSGATILVFKSDDELEDFEKSLDSVSAAAHAMKLEMIAGRLKLVTANGIGELIKQIKG